MERNFLQEAFQKLSLLEDDFNLSDLDRDKVDELKAFIPDDVEVPEEEEIIDVIDPEAKDEDDLEDIYTGKVILECTCCHSRIYKDKAEVVIEDDIANPDEACPVCGNNMGFLVIGKIEAFNPDRKIEDEDELEPEEDSYEKSAEDLEDEEAFPADDIEDEEEKKESLKNHPLASEDSKKLDEADENIPDPWGKDSVKEGCCDEDLTPDEEAEMAEITKGGVVRDKDRYNDLRKKQKEKPIKEAWTAVYSDADIESLPGFEDSTITRVEPSFGDAENRFDIAVSNPYLADKFLFANGLIGTDPDTNLDLYDDEDLATAGVVDDYDPYDESLEESDIEDNRLRRERADFEAGMKKLYDEDDIEDFDVPSTYDDFYPYDESLKNHPLASEDSKKLDEEVEIKSFEQAKKLCPDCKIAKDARLLKYYQDKGFKIFKTDNGFEARNGKDTQKFDKSGNRLKEDEACPKCGKKPCECEKEEIKESVEVNATDENEVHIEKNDDGSMNINVGSEMEEAPDEEVGEIVPLDDAEQVDIEANDAEPAEDEFAPEEENAEEEPGEEDFDIEDFDEEEFDEMGESFITRTYGNVASYKTTAVKDTKNNFIIEGVITYKNGKHRKTQFVFESAAFTKRGKLVMEGYNTTFSNSKKAFLVRGTLNKGRYVTEAFKYDYTVKQLNESNKQETVRVCGRIKAR